MYCEVRTLRDHSILGKWVSPLPSLLKVGLWVKRWEERRLEDQPEAHSASDLRTQELLVPGGKVSPDFTLIYSTNRHLNKCTRRPKFCRKSVSETQDWGKNTGSKFHAKEVHTYSAEWKNIFTEEKQPTQTPGLHRHSSQWPCVFTHSQLAGFGEIQEPFRGAPLSLWVWRAKI